MSLTCAVLNQVFVKMLFGMFSHIIINWLEEWEGLSDTVLDWLCSYLSERKSFYQLRQLCKDIEYGVLQGSILGPILFSLYHCYANDTQLYVFVSPDNPSPLNALTSGWVKGFYNKWAENRSPTCWSKSWKAEDWDSVC